jgi:hypothetical protein
MPTASNILRDVPSLTLEYVVSGADRLGDSRPCGAIANASAPLVVRSLHVALDD